MNWIWSKIRDNGFTLKPQNWQSAWWGVCGGVCLHAPRARVFIYVRLCLWSLCGAMAMLRFPADSVLGCRPELSFSTSSLSLTHTQSHTRPHSFSCTHTHTHAVLHLPTHSFSLVDADTKDTYIQCTHLFPTSVAVHKAPISLDASEIFGCGVRR